MKGEDEKDGGAEIQPAGERSAQRKRFVAPRILTSGFNLLFYVAFSNVLPFKTLKKKK